MFSSNKEQRAGAQGLRNAFTNLEEELFPAFTHLRLSRRVVWRIKCVIVEIVLLRNGKE